MGTRITNLGSPRVQPSGSTSACVSRYEFDAPV